MKRGKRICKACHHHRGISKEDPKFAEVLLWNLSTPQDVYHPNLCIEKVDHFEKVNAFKSGQEKGSSDTDLNERSLAQYFAVSVSFLETRGQFPTLMNESRVEWETKCPQEERRSKQMTMIIMTKCNLFQSLSDILELKTVSKEIIEVSTQLSVLSGEIEQFKTSRKSRHYKSNVDQIVARRVMVDMMAVRDSKMHHSQISFIIHGRQRMQSDSWRCLLKLFQETVVSRVTWSLTFKTCSENGRDQIEESFFSRWWLGSSIIKVNYKRVQEGRLFKGLKNKDKASFVVLGKRSNRVRRQNREYTVFKREKESLFPRENVWPQRYSCV